MSDLRQARIEVKDRTDDEPDLTAKQRQYIEHLVVELEIQDFPAEHLDIMGKWQASSLIDQLRDLQDGKITDKNQLSQFSPSTRTRPLAWIVGGVLVLIFWLVLR